jgi:hypothetical protein
MSISKAKGLNFTNKRLVGRFGKGLWQSWLLFLGCDTIHSSSLDTNVLVKDAPSIFKLKLSKLYRKVSRELRCRIPFQPMGTVNKILYASHLVWTYCSLQYNTCALCSLRYPENGGGTIFRKCLPIRLFDDTSQKTGINRNVKTSNLTFVALGNVRCP